MTVAPEKLSSSPQPELLESVDGEVLAVRYDVRDLLDEELGANWQADFSRALNHHGQELTRGVNHHSVREINPDARFKMRRLNGDKTYQQFPGLGYLYQGIFQNLMRQALPLGAEDLTAYIEPYYGMDTVEQLEPASAKIGEQTRMEAHIDERNTAILVIEAPKPGKGGELVVANNSAATSPEEIESDATVIQHKSGTLVCFPQGRVLPHFTRPLEPGAGQRIVVSLNYPVISETDEQRESIAAYSGGNL